MTYPHHLLAREGLLFVALAGLTAILSSYLFGWGMVSSACWLALAGVVVLFREPSRTIPSQSGAILCPTDAKVLNIAKVRDPYANRDALLVSLRSSLWPTHHNRSSVDGVVKYVQSSPGSARCEKNAVVIESNGQIVTLVQSASRWAPKVTCFLKAGDTLTKGQRYGCTYLGARLDVYLPVHAVPQVVVGQKVLATTSILATLPKV